MLEALDVVGDDLDDSMSEVNSRRSNLLIPLNYICVMSFSNAPRYVRGQGFEESDHRYVPPPFSIGASSDEDTSSSGSRFKMKLREFHKR